jgi:curved DNA-binding protein CbpA
MELEDFEKAVRDYEKAYKMYRSQESKKLLDNAKLALENKNDYYKIVGVRKNASLTEIRKAYKRKALDHHPDRHADESDEARREHEEKFKEIHRAYETLSDVTKRACYDLKLYNSEYGR